MTRNRRSAKAAEFIRRAERGLGVAIRDGQDRGTVATSHEIRSVAAIKRDIKLGRSTKTSELIVDKPSPTDFATDTELNGIKSSVTGIDRPGIYGLTDGVSDEQFEDAITEARAEGNLSRARSIPSSRSTGTPTVASGVPPIVNGNRAHGPIRGGNRRPAQVANQRIGRSHE